MSEPGSGTYGLSFPVAAAGESVLAAGERGLLFAPPDRGAERLNVSLFAPFEASEAEVELLAAGGAVLRSIPVSLPALRRTQLDDLLAGSPAAVSVRVRVGAGRVQAWGTAISNSPTNDPWRVPALPLAAASRSWSVPAVASAPGRNGAFFTSDLFLHAPAGAALDATLLPRDGSAPATAPLVLAPGEVRLVADLLATLFPAKAPAIALCGARIQQPHRTRQRIELQAVVRRPAQGHGVIARLPREPGRDNVICACRW